MNRCHRTLNRRCLDVVEEELRVAHIKYLEMHLKTLLQEKRIHELETQNLRLIGYVQVKLP